MTGLLINGVECDLINHRARVGLYLFTHVSGSCCCASNRLAPLVRFAETLTDFKCSDACEASLALKVSYRHLEVMFVCKCVLVCIRNFAGCMTCVFMFCV